MPDLVTHAAAAYFITRPSRFRDLRVLFYLGTILPDLLSRPLHILWPHLHLYTIAAHTPLFMLIFCLLLSELFPPSMRRAVFGYSFAGAALHFALDLFQRHLGDGYYWLFPFSWRSFELGWLWPETSIRFIPIWLALILILELFLQLGKRRIDR